MSPRKDYDQVALDVFEKHPDMGIPDVAKHVVQGEIEHQARQYATRLSTQGKSDAREVGAWLSGETAETTW